MASYILINPFSVIFLPNANKKPFLLGVACRIVCFDLIE